MKRKRNELFRSLNSRESVFIFCHAVLQESFPPIASSCYSPFTHPLPSSPSHQHTPNTLLRPPPSGRSVYPWCRVYCCRPHVNVKVQDVVQSLLGVAWNEDTWNENWGGGLGVRGGESVGGGGVIIFKDHQT